MEKVFNKEESIELIERMMLSGRKSFSKNSFLYLLWGWLAFIASLAFYFLMVSGYKNAAIVWNLMLVGAVIHIIYIVRTSKNKKVKTLTDVFLSYLWIGFSISIWLIVYIYSKSGWGITSYPIIICLYGLGTFTSGGAMEFKPLILGGVSCWILAVLALFVSLEHQLLILPLAVLLSYIIPGHMLQYKYRNEGI